MCLPETHMRRLSFRDPVADMRAGLRAHDVFIGMRGPLEAANVDAHDLTVNERQERNAVQWIVVN